MVIKCPKCHTIERNLQHLSFDIYPDGFAKATCKCKKCGTMVGIQFQAKTIFEIPKD